MDLFYVLTAIATLGLGIFLVISIAQAESL